MVRRVTLLCISAAVVIASTASAFEVRSDHPRIFVTSDDLARIRARCGVVDGDNQSAYAGEWNQLADVYADLLDAVESYDGDDVPEGGVWGLSRVRSYSAAFSNLATAYLINAHTAEGDAYAATLRTWWSAALSGSADFNDWGKNGNWAGFCMAYDYLHEHLGSVDPSLQQDVAQWILQQSLDGYNYIGGNGSLGVHQYRHYYKWPWVADGTFGALLTIRGDAGVDVSTVDEMLDWTHTFKEWDMDARAKNFCGTYSGYREERIEEDVSCALAWQSAVVDEDPYVTYGYHFRNLDDWVMHMTRPNFMESDETGDGHDLYHLSNRWVYYAYPSAVMDADPHTLWFLDRAREEVSSPTHPWTLLLWNDPSLPREAPSHTNTPLGKYFGDLSHEDGYNSQYTHMRSAWSFSSGDQSTVHGSYLCGPKGMGHDLHSVGHLAMFRGQDIVSASAGVYDGTSKEHTKFYHSSPISENTILVMDPANPYAAVSVTDSVSFIAHREGTQAGSPRVSGGAGIYTADDAYHDDHEIGWVTRFRVTDDHDVYLHSDLTPAYPSVDKPHLWTEGQTVENVSRQVLFEAGRYFVVMDRVTSVNPDAVKRVIMHVPSPEGITLIDGAWTGGIAPHSGATGGTPGQWTDNGTRYLWSKGSSRAFATVLYPELASRGGPGRNLVRVGGSSSDGSWNRSTGDRSFEFYLREADRNFAWSEQYITGGEFDILFDQGQMGFWRTEIEATGAKGHAFLHVYEVTGTDQSTPTAVSYLDDVEADRVGCVIQHPGGPRVTVFSRDEESDDGSIYRTDLVPADEELLHLVADLRPGTYRVTETRSGFTADVVVDEHRLASFSTPGGGDFRVWRLDDEDTLTAGR